ncbi:hypothetical protein ACTNEO_12685 [Gracilibacillus sp. HCP3S3_G5_1]|uniref:hypothetical protein n=1 Tax=unclassified Gracilibacillus TaxID=2625209 RepID=UPI003F8B5684
MQDNHIDHVAIRVHNHEQSANWYLMGFQRIRHEKIVYISVVLKAGKTKQTFMEKAI